MTQLVIPTTVDTPSTDGNCLYPGKPLGGSPVVSPNIKIGGKPVEFYTSATVPDTVEGVKVNPLLPLPCQPGVRVILTINNTTVFFNNQLPAVVGDLAQMASTARPLVGPYGSPTIIIGSTT